MRALYLLRRIQRAPLTDNVVLAIGLIAAAIVLAIQFAWGLPE